MLRSNGERLWASIEAMAGIGRTAGGGCERIALTPADAAARQVFVLWASEAGCSITVDGIANQFARRAGTDPAALPVMIGSHLDTTWRGGRFDGVFGVLAGLEVVRTLNEHGLRTRRPVEVVNWTNEEGARFVSGCTGSKVFAGVEPFAKATAWTDHGGVSISHALTGFTGPAPIGHPAAVYIEPHVELGPELAEAGVAVGIVTGSMSVRGYDVVVQGERNHIGTTPMRLRRNALLGAAEVMLAGERIGLEAAHGRTNTTTLYSEPDSQDIIPDRAALKLDFREQSQERIGAMEAAFRAECEAIARRRGLIITVDEYWRHGPVRFDDRVVAALRHAAKQVSVPVIDVASWTGHDAVYVAQACPTAMLFAASSNGLGHNEREHSHMDDLSAATNVLLHTVLALAE